MGPRRQGGCDHGAWPRFGAGSAACRTLGAAIALGVAALAWPGAAAAQLAAPPPSAPVVSVAETVPGCPGEEELEARIQALIETPSAGVRARVTIADTGSGFEAHVQIVRDTSSAVRILHGRTCDALAGSVALVIAMVIDPTAAERAVEAAEGGGVVEVESTGEGESTQQVETEAEGEDGDLGEDEDEEEDEDEGETDSGVDAEGEGSSEGERHDEPTPAPAPPLAVSFVAEALFLGGVGLLPQPTVGGLVLAGVRIEGVELSLGAAFLAESRAQTTNTRGGDFGLALGRFRVAYAIDLAPVEIVPSVALDVGATWGRGYGVVHPGAGTALSVDVALGVEGRVFFLRELGVVLFAELDVPTLRPSFVLTGISTTPVFRANDVAALFGIGVIARIP